MCVRARVRVCACVCVSHFMLTITSVGDDRYSLENIKLYSATVLLIAGEGFSNMSLFVLSIFSFHIRI